jgi:hypothetical protein
MSVVNEFKVKSVRYSSDPKQVDMIDESGNQSIFVFDFYCHDRPTATKFNFFFNMHNKQLLIIYGNNGSHKASLYECGLMRFWVSGDVPIPSCNWLQNMPELMNNICEQFAEQLASFTIDQIINSSESESV